MKTFRLIGWFFLIGTAFSGALLTCISLITESFANGSNTAPLQGAVSCIEAAICMVCIIVIFICLQVRPKSFTPLNYSIAIGSYTAVVMGLWAAAHLIGHYTLTIHVVDSTGYPIAGVSCKYESFPLGQGIGKFDHLAEGAATTDASGTITISTNHAHEIYIMIIASRFKTTSFMLFAGGSEYPQQLTGDSASTISVSGNSAKNNDLIPVHGNISMKVMLTNAEK